MATCCEEIDYVSQPPTDHSYYQRWIGDRLRANSDFSARKDNAFSPILSPSEPSTKASEAGSDAQWYTSQPFERLARVLEDQGADRSADAVRFAGKDLERQYSSSWLRRIWLTILWIFVGYGYSIWRAYIWWISLLAAGVAILWFWKQPEGADGLGKVVYSFDMLVPVFKLDEKSKDVRLHGFPRVYFLVHKILGWGLAAFIAASASGLLK
jgi:hypothetical protein